MAKKKSGVSTTQSTELENVPKQEITVKPAGIIEPDKKADMEVPMPDVGYEVDQEAPSSITPIVDFQSPGDWVAGEYVGTRDNIGPNASRLYDLKVDGNYFCSIWGCTILDTKMDMLNPKPGQTLLVQYIGSVPTSRNQNPAKNFRVATVTKKA